MTLARLMLAWLCVAAGLGLAPQWAFADRSSPIEVPTCCKSDSLVRSLLEAGGSTSAEATQGVHQFRTFAEQFRACSPLAAGERQQARAIHKFIHEQILGGNYDATAGDLAVVLDGGPYNCATASAVFLALASEVGLKAHAVAVPGHVWCRVEGNDETFDIETTCLDWFELLASDDGVDKQPSKGILAEHRGRAVAGRILDEVALVAVFHYNRGVRLFRSGRYLAAAEANLVALAFDPTCEPAFNNLLGAFNDWSLELAAAGRRDEALSLLVRAMAAAPQYEPFRVNHRFLSRGDAAATLERETRDLPRKTGPIPDFSRD